MNLKELIAVIDSFAPFFAQESYDNSGIQCGDFESVVDKILLALDITVDVVKEAKNIGANTILTHHPPLFFPQKRIIKSDNEAFFEAISNRINVVSAHTNFDLATNGLNDYFCKLIGVKKIKPILDSSEKTYKLAVYVPKGYEESIANSLFGSGAGSIGNYSETSFNIEGTGTFKPNERAHPFIGTSGKREQVGEIKIETVVRERDLSSAIESLKKSHPYEAPAYDIYEIKSESIDGIGALGEIDKEISIGEFAASMKKKTNANYLRLIGKRESIVKTVAVCTGAGGSLISNVKHSNVDLFITGDLTYHQALDLREAGLNTIEIEHYDSEKFFVEAMYENLSLYIDKNIILKSNSMKSPFEII